MYLQYVELFNRSNQYWAGNGQRHLEIGYGERAYSTPTMVSYLRYFHGTVGLHPDNFRASRSPSVQWSGRLVRRYTLEAGATSDATVHYFTPSDIADQGSWTLQASNGRDTWQIVGSESLTRMQNT